MRNHWKIINIERFYNSHEVIRRYSRKQKVIQRTMYTYVISVNILSLINNYRTNLWFNIFVYIYTHYETLNCHKSLLDYH